MQFYAKIQQLSDTNNRIRDAFITKMHEHQKYTNFVVAPTTGFNFIVNIKILNNYEYNISVSCPPDNDYVEIAVKDINNTFIELTRWQDCVRKICSTKQNMNEIIQLLFEEIENVIYDLNSINVI